MSAVISPFVPILTPGGAGLSGGKIYIGVPNEDPETNPQAVYWDQGLTIPASQPLSTAGGLIYYVGSPAIPYTAGPYSMKVKTAQGVQVFYAPNVQIDAFCASIEDYGVSTANSAGQNGAALQLAFDSGSRALSIPPKRYPFNQATLPAGPLGFTLFGVGPASCLVQTGTGLKFTTNLSVNYYSIWLRDFAIDGHSGTGHSIDTTYAGGVTISNLYFSDVPVGYDALYINGSATTYDHDIRVQGMQVYSATAGHAAIGLGPDAADLSIDNLIVGGEFALQYGVYAYNGSLTFRITNSHIYNLTHNAFCGINPTNGAPGVYFGNCVFDNCTQDVVYLDGYNGTIISDCHWEAIQVGKNGLTLHNCTSITVTDPLFDGVNGAAYAVSETGTTDYTTVRGGAIQAVPNFTNPPFNFLNSDHSRAIGVGGYTPLGQQLSQPLSGTSITAGQTRFLGTGGVAAANADTAMPAPFDGHVLSGRIAFDAAPGAGETLTVTLMKNGVALTAASGSANPLVVSGASSFGGSIQVAPGSTDVVQMNDVLSFQIVASGGAAATRPRGAIDMIG